MPKSVHHAKTDASRFAKPKLDRFKSPLDKAKGYEVIWPNVAPLFEATRHVTDCSYVYFIGEQPDGPVKIGQSKDPINRLRAMQTGNSRRLRVEHVLVGTVHTERLMQEMWAEYAIFAPHNAGKADALPGTEWFRPEIRTELDPILKRAVTEQIEWLDTATGEQLERDDCEAAIRRAHGAFGFVARPRDETRLLAEGAGTVIVRRSYI